MPAPSGHLDRAPQRAACHRFVPEGILSQNDSSPPTEPMQASGLQDRKREPKAHGPASPRELFVVMTFLTLQSFGGALALLERTVVQKKRWMTQNEFVELLAVSQVLPGPSGCCFCVLMGDRFFGVRGALAAVTGFLLVPTVLVLSMTAVYQRYADLPAVAGALHGMGAASIGLIVTMTVRMATVLKKDWARACIAMLVFIAAAPLHLSLGHVILLVGLPSYLLAWRRLKHEAGR